MSSTVQEVLHQFVESLGLAKDGRGGSPTALEAPGADTQSPCGCRQRPSDWFRGQPKINPFGHSGYHMLTDVDGEFLLHGPGGWMAATRTDQSRSVVRVDVQEDFQWPGWQELPPKVLFERLYESVIAENEGVSIGDDDFEVSTDTLNRLAILAFANWVSWNADGRLWNESEVTV